MTRYRHHFLCSRSRGIEERLPLDPNCSFCQRQLKEPHQEAIEDQERRAEWKKAFGKESKDG